MRADFKYLTKKLMEEDKKVKEEIREEFTEIPQEELDALWNEIYSKVFNKN